MGSIGLKQIHTGHHFRLPGGQEVEYPIQDRVAQHAILEAVLPHIPEMEPVQKHFSFNSPVKHPDDFRGALLAYAVGKSYSVAC